MVKYPILFFVVDRPMSLKLLDFCKISKLPFKVGLMGHANTSKNFQKHFREFGGRNIIKMADSAVFTKDGCIFNGYEKLFEIYENMGVEYGIMIDVLKNKDETLRSAEKAIGVYESGDYDFNLVGVAQGNSIEEYLDCYEKLKEVGFKYIGIGGLLKKIENSSRYVKIRDENFLQEVVKKVRKKYPNDWLFLLGCFHPKRINFFREYKIFGADYKGWILNYNPPTDEERRIKNKEELRRSRFIQIKRYLYSTVFSNYVSQKKRLLLVSCSKRKRPLKGRTPAIDLYDGPQFRLLRKYLDVPNLDIYIVSAKYGLVESSEYIEFYDQKMTAKRAEELRESVVQTLNSVLEQNHYSEVLINLGRDYLRALDGFREKLVYNHNCKIVIVEGRVGKRLKKMKKWLESFKGGDKIEHQIFQPY